MSRFDEYDTYDAVGLAELIRRGDVHPDEVLDTAIEHIEARNPALNAVVHTIYDSARRRVGATDAIGGGPLAGVPYLVKDSGIQLAGERTSNGSRFWRDHLAVADSTITTRLRAAGLTLLGFTNTAENGLASETAPAAYGHTVNPWDATRSCGGSSGGSGVAVAAGMVPAAHATDGGGSIRIPAACSGLFGLKPTRGRNPSGPDVGEGWNGMSVHHAITRSVRDSAALLDATHGPEPGDPYAAPPHDGTFLQALDRPLPRLRIAVQHVGHDGVPVHPTVIDAVEQVAALASSLGHHVEVARPDIDVPAMQLATRIIVASNTANVLKARSEATGRPITEDEVEPITLLWGQEGLGRSGQELAWSVGAIHRVGRAFGRFFANHDLLLTPTCASPPLPLRTIDMASHDLDAYYETLCRFTIFTSIYNCAGLPAANVPLVWTDGLPIGVQLAGPLGADALVLRLAAELEQARPWAHRRPPVPSGA